MKKKWLSKNRIIGICIIVACLLIALVLSFVRQRLISNQDAQRMAERWKEDGGDAQISCFFSREANVSREQLDAFEHQLDNVLQEASIKLESEENGARLWADAYSSMGSLTVSTERAMLSLKAMGVGGDFFQFHPQKLLYGNYFSGRDVNSDYVVIDEETAWQLFGGIDVSGKFVTIGERPHMIAGVIKRPKGRMEKAAGLDDSVIYVSMDTLEQYGISYGISSYEIVMPNPIKDFAMQKIKENLGVDEQETVYLENTGRFSIVNSLKILLDYGYRSMNGRAIIYPYWENLARGCEDRLALVTLFFVTLLGIPCMIVFCFAIHAWRHKGWTFGTALQKLSDLVYRMQSDWVGKRQNRKKKSKKDPIRVIFEEEKNEKDR